MKTEIEISINSTDRESIRKELITLFLEEMPGTGKGDLCSKYYYYVEKLANGKKIFLKRPARLNKGFDFEVNVEDLNFGTNRLRTTPSHANIYNDIKAKLIEDSHEFGRVKDIIKRTYNCENIHDDEIRTLTFNSGFPIEVIIKSVKWLFIEQDITYWNWSGRNMLYSGLCKLWSE